MWPVRFDSSGTRGTFELLHRRNSVVAFCAISLGQKRQKEPQLQGPTQVGPFLLRFGQRRHNEKLRTEDVTFGPAGASWLVSWLILPYLSVRCSQEQGSCEHRGANAAMRDSTKFEAAELSKIWAKLGRRPGKARVKTQSAISRKTTASEHQSFQGK